MQKDSLQHQLKRSIDSASFSYGRHKLAQSIDCNSTSSKKLASRGRTIDTGLPLLSRCGTQESNISKTVGRYVKHDQYYRHQDPNKIGETPKPKAEVRHDALGQRVRDRFNEDAESIQEASRAALKTVKLNSKILGSGKDTLSGKAASRRSVFGKSGKSGRTVTISEMSRMFNRAVEANPITVEPPRFCETPLEL